jgi:hypothetical protein
MSETHPTRSGNRPAGHDEWTLYDPNRDNLRTFEDRATAEDKKQDLEGLGADLDLYPPGESPDALLGGDGDDDAARDDDAGQADASSADGQESTDDPHSGENGDGDRPAETDGATDANGRPVETVEKGGVEADVIDHSPEASPAQADTVAVDQADAEPVTTDADGPGPADLPDRSVADDPLTWIPGEFVDDIDGSQAINRKGYEVLSHFYNVDVAVELQTPPEDTGHEYARVKATATTADGRTCEAFGSAHLERGDDPELLLEMADTRARKRALSIATGVGAVAVAELKNEVDT